MSAPRLAVRAVLIHNERLLLVIAWRRGSDLLCAPGGGVEAGSALPDNLQREVYEETGLTITVGPPCLVNEFHDPASGYHQVEVFFRCTSDTDKLPDVWRDPEGVVQRRRWATQAEMADLRVKPDSLARVAWQRGFGYDPLEVIVR